MIPTTVENEENVIDFEIVEKANEPTLTYRMDLDNNRVRNWVDGQAAMKQVIFKILQTERYDHPEIYSDNYGVEFKELFGQPTAWVIPEIERRIKEALLYDERITNVYNFTFEVNRNVVSVTFYVDTIFGSIEIDDLKVNF